MSPFDLVLLTRKLLYTNMQTLSISHFPKYGGLNRQSKSYHSLWWKKNFKNVFKLPFRVRIYRARGPYEEIFVLTFKAYGLNAVRSMRLECQNKYIPYGPKSRLIRALLYTYTNKIVYDEILLS